MIYSSYEFMLFLPPLVAWFYSLASARSQNLLLLSASLIFLGWTDIWNLAPALIVVIGVWAWFVIDARLRTSRWAMGVVVGLLVAQLAYLKYRGFIFETFGLSLPVPSGLATLIPLGISFYSFEAISAVVDLRRRPSRLGPLSWSLFILFLPHLIAGPIVRLRQLAPQFEQAKRLQTRNILIGLHFFTIGFAKKLLADPVGRIVDPIWSAPEQASSLTLLLALIGFSAQLYLDFSGYTDMGRGIARMLGFRLPLNFRAPFFARSPGEFYQRWHVSLSGWIRVFVYDTLAVAVFRRVRGRVRQNRALFAVILLVMAIFGLWHGSAWHFVLFGVAQGLLIAGWAAITKGRAPRRLRRQIAALLILQASWLLSLVLFRADSLPAAGRFFWGLLGGSTATGDLQSWDGLLWCPLAMAIALLIQAVEYFVQRRPLARALCWLRASTAGGALVAACLIGAIAFKLLLDARAIAEAGLPTSSFIYFRF